MTSKINITTRYKIIIATIFIIVGMLCLSYSSSRKTAKMLVGSSLKYFQLNKTKLVIEPIHRKSIVWMFEFSCPSIMDADFEIYTSMLGQLVITNPRSLENRLRSNEKLDIHPYSSK